MLFINCEKPLFSVDSSDNSSDDDNVAALQQLQSHQNSYHTDGQTKRGRGRGRGRGSGRGRGKAKPPTSRLIRLLFRFKCSCL